MPPPRLERWWAYDIAWTVVAATVAFSIGQVKRIRPHRFFVERDPALSYPFIDHPDQAIPTWLLGLAAVIIPGLVVFGTQLYRLRHEDKCGVTSSPFRAMMGFSQALLSTKATTGVLKMMVGRWRPNAFGMCNYKGYRDAAESGDFSAYLAATEPGRPGDPSQCHDQDGMLEAARSFPSGHASLAFAGLGFVAVMWFVLLRESEGAAGVNGRAGGRPFGMFRCALPLVPIMCAVIISASRIQDMYHNPDDVIGGVLIGFAYAVAAFYWSMVPRDGTVLQDGTERVVNPLGGAVPPV